MGLGFAVLIVIGVVILAVVLGVIIRRAEGRQRQGGDTAFHAGDLPGLTVLASGATLVQFSTEFCTTCPNTRRFLRQVADSHSDVSYLDVDLTYNGDLASQLHILQTPTVFVLDPRGRLVSRFGGAPKPVELRATLDQVLQAA